MKLKLTLCLIFLCTVTFGQKKSKKIDCNTVFVCVDSTAYSAIFSSSFVRDTLFFCREKSTSTKTDSYTGKYAIGKAATIEFFKPSSNNKLGDNFGDVGIEFKTRKLGFLNQFVQTTKKNKLKYTIDKTFATTEDGDIPWYNTLNLKHNNPKFAISLLEYQKEYLAYVGFSNNEIEKEMTFSDFNNKLSQGKKYPRQFNKIKSLTIEINKNELAYLKNMAVIFGLKFSQNSISNDDFTLNYKIAETDKKFVLKSIEVELIDALQPKKTVVSEQVSILTSGKSATIKFNY